MNNDTHIILDKELRRDIDAIIQRIKEPSTFQQRVVEEKDQLDTKLAKLKPFFSTPMFAKLGPEEQERMQRQAAVMEDYSGVLGERISNFAPTPPSADKQPDGFRRSRERSLAVTKLQEAVMWLGMDLKAINDENRPHEAEVEALAKTIYDEIRASDPEGQSRPWVEGGNSWKQTEARQIARARLSPCANPYPNSKDPSNTKIEPTADGLKL